MEVWKDCSGFRNKYQASNLGRIKSLNYNKTKREAILSQFKTCGYLCVCLDNKRQLVHRVVAKAFLPNPENLPEIDHINRNKLDNRIENLRWASKSQNAINRAPRPNLTGELCITLTKEQSYRVSIRRQGTYFRKTFKTLEEAVEARNKILDRVEDES